MSSTLQSAAVAGGNRSRSPSINNQPDQLQMPYSSSLPNVQQHYDEDPNRFTESANDDIIRAMPVAPSNASLADLGRESVTSTLGQSSSEPRRSEGNEATLERLEDLILRERSTSRVKCERTLKRKLRFFFMSPVEKWRKRRQFPYKLLLELAKIAIVTIQLSLYGYDRSEHLAFQEQNSDALRHIFQPGFHDTSLANSIRCSNCIEIYRLDQLYNTIDNLVTNYYNIEHIGVGTYLRDFDKAANKTAPLIATITNLNVSRLYNDHGVVYELDARQVTEQVVLLPKNASSPHLRVFDPEAGSTQILDLTRFLHMSVKFILHSVAYHRILVSQKPSCVTFYLNMEYNNWERSGMVMQELYFSSSFEKPCSANIIYFDSSSLQLAWRFIVIIFVFCLSFSSMVLCIRSAIRSERLRLVTMVYFDKYLNRDLRWKEDGGSEFLDLWLYLIIVTDILLLSGSICWIVLIETSTVDLYEETAIILGVGTLLSWFSILRYLNYYQKLSLLLLTLKRAFPEVMRFLLCALVFFCGYLFFGWILFGPFSSKFRTLSMTAEQLFSLVNGDDMFATFSSIAYDQSVLIWLVSRLYLYSFICLYIYVVLSLFIAIIIDVYEEIKEGWRTKKFRPYSPTLRQLMSGSLTRQSSEDRRKASKANDRVATVHGCRNSSFYQGVVLPCWRCFCRCLPREYSSFQADGQQMATVKWHAPHIDASRYNLPHSPAIPVRSGSTTGRQSDVTMATSPPSVSIEIQAPRESNEQDNVTTITVISSGGEDDSSEINSDQEEQQPPIRRNQQNQSSTRSRQSVASSSSNRRVPSSPSAGAGSTRRRDNQAPRPNPRPDSIFFL